MMSSEINNPWLEVAKKKNPPYIANCDKDIKLADFYSLRLELLPVPYSGNLDKAKVVVLLLNPGYSSTEDEMELECSRLQQALRDNLDPAKSRLFQLDDEFDWTAGGRWMRSKFLKPLTEAGLGVEDLMEKMMIVEYFPYHSRRFDVNLKEPLASQEYNFQLVREAIRREKIILLMRSASWWCTAVPELKNYKKCFKPSSTRNTILSRKNLGNECFDEIVRSLKSE